MMRSALSAVIVACVAALPVAAVAEPTCDQAWMVVSNSPFAPKKPKGKYTSEESYRYTAGAVAFAKANDMVKTLSPEEVANLSKADRMQAALGFGMGDRLMTCYGEAAATTDGGAAFVKAMNGAFPSEKRAELVAKYKLAD